MSETSPMTVPSRASAPRPAQDDRCELCGAFTDRRIAGRTICDVCYEERSSCCPEFGGSDLWREREDL